MMHGACACTSGYAHICALFGRAPIWPFVRTTRQKRRKWKTWCSAEDRWMSELRQSAARTRGGESRVGGVGGMEDIKHARIGRRESANYAVERSDKNSRALPPPVVPSLPSSSSLHSTWHIHTRGFVGDSGQDDLGVCVRDNGSGLEVGAWEKKSMFKRDLLALPVGAGDVCTDDL